MKYSIVIINTIGKIRPWTENFENYADVAKRIKKLRYSVRLMVTSISAPTTDDETDLWNLYNGIYDY